MMKIRIDFVTNSSSSSYILAYKLDTEDEKYERYRRMINRFIKYNEDCDSEVGTKITSIEELNDFFLDEYGRWYDFETLEEILYDKEFKDKYEEYKEYLEKGYSLISKEIGYHMDDDMSDIKDMLIEKDILKILECDC